MIFDVIHIYLCTWIDGKINKEFVSFLYNGAKFKHRA
jgi:hypothetical protein